MKDVGKMVTREVTSINLPFSLYLLNRAVKEKWMSRKAMAFIVPTGLLFHVIGIPLIIILSGTIVNSVWLSDVVSRFRL